jgi:hypothetical protein
VSDLGDMMPEKVRQFQLKIGEGARTF